MPNIGLLSGALEEKEYGWKPRSRVYAGKDYGWQTQASYEKLQQERNRGIGSKTVDFIKDKTGQVLNFASQIPGVKQSLQFAEGAANLVNEIVVQPAIQAAEDPSQIGTPQALVGSVFKGSQMAEKGGAQIARDLGVDSRIGAGVGTASFDTLTGAGLTKASKIIKNLPPSGGNTAPILAGNVSPNITVNNGSVNLQPTVNRLTITNPDFIARGVKEGVASGPDFGPAMRKWNARRNELIEQRRNPQGSSASRRNKNRNKSLITAYNDVSTGPTTDPLDVNAYGKAKFKVKGKEQHHLFPKQESYQFVERMKEIGDDDDVLNLFLYAEEIDATMGGRLSNMLNMDKKPHNNLHGNRIKDGRQLGSMKMKNLVQSAKSTDELMQLFDRYIVENIGPSKVEARRLQQAFDQAKQNLNSFKSLTEAQRRRL